MATKRLKTLKRPTRYKLPITSNFLVPPESHSAQEDRTSSQQMLDSRPLDARPLGYCHKKAQNSRKPNDFIEGCFERACDMLLLGLLKHSVFPHPSVQRGATL